VTETAPRPLVIRTVEFIGPMADAGGWRPESNLPEIALAGRSNVGKSSLINRLLGRRAVARVSRTPGRTREINFFRINDRFVLADLPGYGYARVSKERKAAWGPLLENYLRDTPRLRGVVQLMDIRRDPTADDLAMLEFLSTLDIPGVIVLTKADKLSRAAAAERHKDLADGLGLPEEQLIPFSSETGEGRDALARVIEEIAVSGT
jgi:GTP-binding protein